MIERQARLADGLRARLVEDGWQIVNNTPLPLVCFTRDGLATDRFLAEVYAHQIAWMSEVRLRDGAKAIRACVTSWRTQPSDVESVARDLTRLALRDCEVTA